MVLTRAMLVLIETRLVFLFVSRNLLRQLVRFFSLSLSLFLLLLLFIASER